MAGTLMAGNNLDAPKAKSEIRSRAEADRVAVIHTGYGWQSGKGNSKGGPWRYMKGSMRGRPRSRNAHERT